MNINIPAFLILFFPAQVLSLSAEVREWNLSTLNTAAHAEYLSAFEKELILEINKLRSDPALYADEFLVPLTRWYKGNILYYPNDKPLHTLEGKNALYDCVRDLKGRKAVPLVYPSRGLSKAAADHVSDQSKTGQTGHIGADGSGFKDRMERHGEWKGRISENIAYGGKYAQQILIYLLIDDGIKDRGHRKTFLNPDFHKIGLASGSHPGYDFMCVMDFAGLYHDR